MSFVHLHVHSEYSLIDGCASLQSLISQAKKWGQKALALTDHGNMHGAVDFFFAAKKAQIQPIIGCEIFLELPPFLKSHKTPSHLILLARNEQGYKHLMKIVSQGYLGKVAQTAAVPIVSRETLQRYGEGLIALSGCLEGEFPRAVSQWKESSWKEDLPFVSFLKEHTAWMRESLQGPYYYVELTDNGWEEQRILLPKLVQAAKYCHLPVVATGDVHYIEPDFAETHVLAVAIKNQMTVKDFSRRLTEPSFAMESSESMAAKFSSWPEAIRATEEIAELCQEVHISTGKYHFPKVPLPENFTAREALEKMAHEGLEKRKPRLESFYGHLNDFSQYTKRLNYELSVIISMGFADYFLIVQDFINWAKKQKIPVGPGRGSGVGSLVAYSLGITDLDPIPYGLIFQRFLNPDRISMPDFDVDFCQWRRDEVIQYCMETYGHDRVAQITTFGKLMAKGAVKSVGRAMDIGFSRMDRFTKLFPDDLGIHLKDCLLKEPRITQELESNEELASCFQEALKLEGMISHTSVHAAGIVISHGPMTDYSPVYTTDGQNLITQYEMKPVEKIGLIKFDFLGLTTLTILSLALDAIHDRGIDLDLGFISLQDAKVYELLHKGWTCGVFQCESPGMTQLIMKLKPSSFEDIMALVALYRPGPLGSGMVEDFIERKHGRKEIAYLHPLLEEVLKETYGIILYQEHVQKIAAVLADYSLGEGDLLRKAMGKKIPEEMAKQKGRFLEGAEAKGVEKEKAEKIFDLMAEFAKYGFNKSHSAAYGLITYQTAYLKTHFPREFLAAAMTCSQDRMDKILKFWEDSKLLGVFIHGPDILLSEEKFSVQNEQVIWGLGAIKGLGKEAIRPLLEERKRGPYESLQNMAQRVPLNLVGKKNLQILGAAGALDRFGAKRSDLQELCLKMYDMSLAFHEAKLTGQKPLGLGTWDIKILEKKWLKPINYQDILSEKKLLGVYVSGHPWDFFTADELLSPWKIKDFQKIFEKPSGKVSVSFAAFLADVRIRRTKSGTLMGLVKLEQGSSHWIEAMVFGEKLSQKELPPVESLIWVEGILEPRFGKQHEWRLVLQDWKPLEAVRMEKTKKIFLKFQAQGSPVEPIAHLEQIFLASPGPIPIKMQITLDDLQAQVVYSLDRTVTPTNKLLESLTCFDSMSITYQLFS